MIKIHYEILFLIIFYIVMNEYKIYYLNIKIKSLYLY